MRSEQVIANNYNQCVKIWNKFPNYHKDAVGQGMNNIVPLMLTIGILPDDVGVSCQRI